MNAAAAVLGPSLARGLADAPALIDGARVLTYGDVQRATDQCAQGLRALGIGREQRVLIACRDSPEFVSVYLGAMKLGAVAVPVNPRSPAEELLFYLQDSRAQAAVLDADVLPVYQGIAGDLAEPPIVIVRGGSAVVPGAQRARGPDGGRLHALEDFFAQPSRPFEAVPMASDDMAFWIYTSGTTGEAKAAVHVQHDVLPSDAYLRETLGVTQGTRLFATSKLFFAYALGTCLFGSFRLGATTILHGEWPTPEGVREVLAKQRPEVVFSVPAVYRGILRAGMAGQGPFRTVRTWVSAGEKLPQFVARGWREEAGAEIVEGMGTSETIYMFLSNRPGASEPGSAGTPAPTAQVRLVDGEGQPIATPHRQGLLQVRMESVCDRYWNRQQATREAMQGPWFSTGDWFTCDARGRWTHRGRQGDLLHLAGRWVNPAEIEEPVLALPEVADAAAVGVAGPGGAMRIALYIVPAAPERVLAVPETLPAPCASSRLPAALRQAIAGRISAFPGLDDVRFVPELPRTASGKVQRYRLRQELARESGTKPYGTAEDAQAKNGGTTDCTDGHR